LIIKLIVKKKANDIDPIACNKTKNNFLDVDVYNKNALFQVDRKNV